MTKRITVLTVTLVLFHLDLAFAKTINLLPSVYRDISTTQIMEGSEGTTLKFNLNKIDVEKSAKDSTFTIQGKTSFQAGAPKIPFISTVIEASQKINQNDIKLIVGKEVVIDSFIPTPAAPEKCRCTSEVKEAKIDPTLYNRDSLYKIENLGDFRGKNLYKITLYPARVNLKSNTTTFFPEVELKISYKKFNFESDTKNIRNDEYVIVYPKALESSANDFADWKESQGFTVTMKRYEDIGEGTSALKNFFSNYYKTSPFKYSLIIGTDDLVPMDRVDTSGDYNTPSDITYYQMGNSGDYIPDVFYGRIVAKTNAQVRRQLQKLQEYTEETFPVGLKNAIGIASNEGWNPSDDEYIKSIESEFESAFGWSFTHFHQDDYVSNPEEINEAFNKGANWLTYMGHGSGYSWASTNETYSATDIKDMRNAQVTKPIFIDVACMNGRALTDYAGERMMNEVDNNQNPVGATAYYGGTVNISWHPPAIMAQGMALKIANSSLTNLSEIVLAGQLHLASQDDSLEDVVDNFEWYHIFGDPSLELKL